MNGKIYTEGFPERWAMVHTDDCTWLSHKPEVSILGSWVCICLAPKLLQGEAWLEQAKLIAHALAGTFKLKLEQTFAEFCDECGIGPPYDSEDRPIKTSRVERSWRCDRCNHINKRPLIAKGD